MQKFRVRFANWHPFSIVTHTRDNKTILRGIVKEIYEAMKAVNGFDYEASIQPGNTFGEKNADGIWSGMLGSTIYNETDLSGPYFVNEERSMYVEFAIPLGFTKVGILTGLVPTNKHTFLVFEIFSVQVWITLLLSLILVSGTACFIYQVLPSYVKRSKIEAFLKYFWAFQASLLGQDFGLNNRWFLRYVYRCRSFQLLQLTWSLVACVVFMYTYKCAIISAFSANKLVPKIVTMDQLLKDTSVAIGTYKQNYLHTFCKGLVGTKYEAIWFRVKENLFPMSDGSIPEWMDLVESGQLVFLADTSHMRSLVSERFLKTGKCGLRLTSIHLGSSFVTVAFGKHFHGSSILKKFNSFLRHFNEGHLAELEYLKSSLYYDFCTRMGSTVTKTLNMSDLLGAFIVLITGICLSILVFILELTIK